MASASGGAKNGHRRGVKKRQKRRQHEYQRNNINENSWMGGSGGIMA
jgi:hypothetical protein